MPLLTDFEVTTGSTNAAVTCTPLCLSSVTTLVAPSSTCPTSEDMAFCGFIAATSIQSVTGYSMWNCTTGGTTSSSPCSPVWPGLSCSGSTVLVINLGGLQFAGSIASSMGFLTSLIGLDLHYNKLNGNCAICLINHILDVFVRFYPSFINFAE